jgi:hypothetical protein
MLEKSSMNVMNVVKFLLGMHPLFSIRKLILERNPMYVRYVTDVSDGAQTLLNTREYTL